LKHTHSSELIEIAAGWERKSKEMSERAASETQKLLSISHANDLHNLKLLHQQALDDLKSQHTLNIKTTKDQHVFELQTLKQEYMTDSEVKM
jgi:hypothetical protein